MRGVPAAPAATAAVCREVDRGDDTAAQIEAAGHFEGRQRNARDRLLAEHVANRQHGMPQSWSPEHEGDELPFVGVGAYADTRPFEQIGLHSAVPATGPPARRSSAAGWRATPRGRIWPRDR